MKTLKTKLALFVLSTVSLLTCAYGQITPSADSYTVTGAPTTNYGSKTLLDVESPTQTTYIQFNLSSIPTTYTSADITKATLKLYVYSVTTAGSFNVDYVNGTWTESTITADLAPALGTTIAASVPLVAADKNQFILIDVTEAVQAWLSGTPNDGIALVGNSPFNATFDSKENTATSHAPELDIVFAGGGTLTGVTTASSSGLTGGGTSGTLNLGLLTTCASGQVLEWNGSAWACATASGTGTITGVTAGTGLTGGGTSGNVALSINTATIPQLSAANAFSGTITAGTSSSSTFGVLGESNATTGQNYGVGGLAQSPSGYGVWGLNAASGGVGVYGNDSAGTGVSGTGATGVYGTGTTTGVYGNGTSYGVYGAATVNGLYGTGGTGVSGTGTVVGVYGTGPTAIWGIGATTGGYGTSASSAGYGVEGVNTASGPGVYGTGTYGVYGNGTSYGVYATGGTYGVYGNGTSYGVQGTGPTGVYGNGTSYGVYATGGTYGVYASGATAGVFGYGSGSDNNEGVYGEGAAAGGDGGFFAGGGNSTDSGGAGASFLGANAYNYGGDGVVATPGGSSQNPGYGGYFYGNINVTGTVFGGSKDFKIDHPLDPANKYLFHSSVESSEMMNIYTGNVTTDGEGLATVQLPDWFEVLNTDFRYQLTVIGQFAQAIVTGEVANHQFSIKTDKPNVKVSWQITGVRQDAYAKAHPLVVEQEKDARERGHYIYPELYGAPEEQSIAWARHPAMMKKMRDTRARQLAAAQGQAATMRPETLPLAVPPVPAQPK